MPSQPCAPNLILPEMSEWKKQSAKSVALNSRGFMQSSMFSYTRREPLKNMFNLKYMKLDEIGQKTASSARTAVHFWMF